MQLEGELKFHMEVFFCFGGVGEPTERRFALEDREREEGASMGGQLVLK